MKSRDGLLISNRDVLVLDTRKLVNQINKTWSAICVNASKLRAVPEEERDCLFWARCSCWRHTVWQFQDCIRFIRDARMIDSAKFDDMNNQIEELVRDVERGDADAQI